MEDDKVEFKIGVEEEDAEVTWYKDGVEIVPDGKRYRVKTNTITFGTHVKSIPVNSRVSVNHHVLLTVSL